MRNKTDTRFNQIILNRTLPSIAKAFAILNADIQNGTFESKQERVAIIKKKSAEAKKYIKEYIDALSDI